MNIAVLYFTSLKYLDGTYDRFHHHYFIKIDNKGQLVWKRAYRDHTYEAEQAKQDPNYLHLLENGDVLAFFNYVD